MNSTTDQLEASYSYTLMLAVEICSCCFHSNKVTHSFTLLHFVCEHVSQNEVAVLTHISKELCTQLLFKCICLHP